MKNVSRFILFVIAVPVAYILLIFTIPVMVYSYNGNGKAIDNFIESTGIYAGRCDYKLQHANDYDINNCAMMYDTYTKILNVIMIGKFVGSIERRADVLKNSRETAYNRMNLMAWLGKPLSYFIKK